MIKNENIICISSIDWDFNWQGHQEIMSLLAKNNNRVLFIENTGVRSPGVRDIARLKNRLNNWFKGLKGIRKIMDNLYVFSPLLLPFPYLRVARMINRHLIKATLDKWIRTTDFSNVIVWTFLPTPLSQDIIDGLSKKIVIYYCIDNLKASSKGARRIAPYEIRLLRKADLVFVTSQNLFDYCSVYSNRVYLFPFAVNFRQFEDVMLKGGDLVSPLVKLRKPIIGYIGGINVKLNQDLIRNLALKYADYSFVFVGPTETDTSLISDLPNIYLLGNKSHNEIPSLIDAFDVCMIPYAINEYTKSIYPAKLNEYHAMGKPIVSTALPEIVYFNRQNNDLIFLSYTQEEFIRNIQLALDSAKNKNLVDLRIESAKKNSWTNRTEEMSGLIAEVIEEKSQRPPNSLDAFFNLCSGLRTNLLPLFIGLLSLYLLVFYTPVAWLLASPLKIVQPVQNSDAIIVLAGGVGESGQPGQGYEERVEYAVQLYKKGFAPVLIFSSGYMYVFKEPLVMRALAISLGVPGSAILLDDRSASTYDNAGNVVSILRQKGWNKVIMVSAPYHMLRLSLVMKKIVPEMRVIYSPIPDSLFYRHGIGPNGEKVFKQITFRQLKAILHEYLSIVYYWIRSRI
ncbi:MAG: ElyC/SanA/YdcF family protein [Candidatus Omnitrophota bacterium]